MTYSLRINLKREDAPDEPFDLAIEFVATDEFNEPGVDYRQVPPGRVFQFNRPIQSLFAYVPEGGYWPLQFDRPTDVVQGVLERIPSGPHGWWHELHGLPADHRRGEGIRIGVVDEALEVQDSTSMIAHVRNLGGRTARAFMAKSSIDHGFGVCALLAARPNSDTGFVGVAPGAEIRFVSAGDDEIGELSNDRLAAAIDKLVEDEDCDIITFSAGDSAEKIPGVHEALIGARARGVLCFAAAGNHGGAPLYPARYDECIAVGAVGDVRVAPLQSTDGQHLKNSTCHKHGNLFHWSHSARGAAVNFIGAGVCVIAADAKGRWYPRSGTSFSAPIVAGVAGVILSKDSKYQQLKGRPERVTHALSCLGALSSNPFPGCCSAGLLVARQSLR